MTFFAWEKNWNACLANRLYVSVCLQWWLADPCCKSPHSRIGACVTRTEPIYTAAMLSITFNFYSWTHEQCQIFGHDKFWIDANKTIDDCRTISVIFNFTHSVRANQRYSFQILPNVVTPLRPSILVEALKNAPPWRLRLAWNGLSLLGVNFKVYFYIYIHFITDNK